MRWIKTSVTRWDNDINRSHQTNSSRCSNLLRIKKAHQFKFKDMKRNEKRASINIAFLKAHLQSANTSRSIIHEVILSQTSVSTISISSSISTTDALKSQIKRLKKHHNPKMTMKGFTKRFFWSYNKSMVITMSPSSVP